MTMAKALSSIGQAISAAYGTDSYIKSPITMAGCVLFIAPLMIMYLFLQNYFVQSVERTGIVG